MRASLETLELIEACGVAQIDRNEYGGPSMMQYCFALASMMLLTRHYLVGLIQAE